jgi:hypothetical protein
VRAELVALRAEVVVLRAELVALRAELLTARCARARVFFMYSLHTYGATSRLHGCRLAVVVFTRYLYSMFSITQLHDPKRSATQEQI